jgi:hypothetical protein
MLARTSHWQGDRPSVDGACLNKEFTMKTSHAFLTAAACLATVGAPAQAQQWDLTSQKSTEMMIPPGLAATILGSSGPMPRSVQSRVTADDRRAADAIARTDMMMPEMAPHTGADDPHAVTQPAVNRLDEDDRRTAEFIRRTDQMRPN